MSKISSTGEQNKATPSPATIPLLVLLGPTAVGKTALALQLAEHLNGEIVSADSRQIYRQMDIGTAKPTQEEQARVPHHALDLVKPDQTLSLSEYQAVATAAMQHIHARGRLPVLVGGTGQYITALLEGWNAPPVAPDPVLRAAYELHIQERGLESLVHQLETRDPQAAAVIDRRNPRRVIRALEVIEHTGKPFSEQQTKVPPPYLPLVFGLTMSRERLHEVADVRLYKMLEHGFVNEVQGLLNSGYAHDLPSMSALGYREIAAHLLDDLPLKEAIAATRRATRDFIRRQYTWFRGHDGRNGSPPIRWIVLDDAAGLHEPAIIMAQLTAAVADWQRVNASVQTGMQPDGRELSAHGAVL